MSEIRGIEYVKKEARPFEEYKEMIQDMSKEKMIKGLYDLSKNVIEKDNEIERLNNELELQNIEMGREIERLTAKNTDLQEQVDYQDLWRKEYLGRIDKAIEYINADYINGEVGGLSWLEVKKLLDILQGSDKE